MVESLHFSGFVTGTGTGSYVLPTASTVTLGGVKVDGTTIHITNGVISATAGTGGVSSFNTRTGAVTLTSSDVTTALTFTPASLASPVFTGNPTAPTPSPGDNDTSLATTAFVTSAVVAATTGVASFNTRTGAVTLSSSDVTTALTYTPANLVSPVFTGNPTAPTASPGDNDTSIATTAFVTAAVSASTAGVASFNTRTGTVTLTSGDVTGALTYTPYNATNPTGYQTAAQVSSAISGLAPLASPAFTGNPTGPTASPGDNDTSLATTAFVSAAVTAATLSGSGGMTTTWFNALPTTTGSAGPWWNDGGLLAFDSTWGGASNDPAATAYAASFNTRTGAVTLNSGDVTTALGFAPPAISVGRNLVHNSMFRVYQRGTGPFTANGAYSADRWRTDVVGCSYSSTLVALADADRTALGDEAAREALQIAITGTAGAGDLCITGHYVEDVRRLAGKTVTISFWAKAASGTPKVAFEMSQNFGSGGSPSAAVVSIGDAAFTLSTTWTRYSTSFTVPTSIGKTFGTTPDTNYTLLNFWHSAGATNSASRASSIGPQSYTMQMWGVQLEVGSTASPIEKLDPRQDFENCLQFYQTVVCSLRIYAAAVQVVETGFMWSTMRSIPTAVVVTPGSNLNATGVLLAPTSLTSGNFSFASAAPGDSYYLNYVYGLSADL